MNHKLKELVEGIKSKKGMYLLGSDYRSLADFLIGYGLGYRDCEGVNILGEAFQDWLKKKVKRDFCLHWSVFILQEIAKGDEEKAEKVLLELLDEFIDTRKE